MTEEGIVGPKKKTNEMRTMGSSCRRSLNGIHSLWTSSCLSTYPLGNN